MLKTITVCLALLFSQSFAASFDCSKAQSNFEQAICGDSILSSQDQALANEYRLARSKLSPSAEKVLVSSQRSWLRFFEIYCFIDFQAMPSSPSEVKRCLRHALKERIQDLSKTGTIIGGMKTYIAIEHHIRVNKKQGSVYVVERTYIQIDHDSSIGTTLNQYLKFKNKVELPDERGTEIYQMTLSQIASDWLYIQNHSEIFTGAYPNGDTTCGLYSLRQNRPLKVFDIFKNQEWKKIVSHSIKQHFLTLSKVEKNFDLSMVQDSEVIDTQQTADFTFCITKNGLYVDGFLPHVVRAYDGVTVSWKSLEKTMTAEAIQQIKTLAEF